MPLVGWLNSEKKEPGPKCFKGKAEPMGWALETFRPRLLFSSQKCFKGKVEPMSWHSKHFGPGSFFFSCLRGAIERSIQYIGDAQQLWIVARMANQLHRRGQDFAAQGDR